MEAAREAAARAAADASAASARRWASDLEAASEAVARLQRERSALEAALEAARVEAEEARGGSLRREAEERVMAEQWRAASAEARQSRGALQASWDAQLQQRRLFGLLRARARRPLRSRRALDRVLRGVPLVALLRCRCVCRGWRALASAPELLERWLNV